MSLWNLVKDISESGSFSDFFLAPATDSEEREYSQGRLLSDNERRHIKGFVTNCCLVLWIHYM